jgi:hypothetical protein
MGYVILLGVKNYYSITHYEFRLEVYNEKIFICLNIWFNYALITFFLLPIAVAQSPDIIGEWVRRRWAKKGQ